VKVYFSHNFRGKLYKILKSQFKKKSHTVGTCDDPTSQDKSIKVPINGNTVEDLDIIIHESAHACLWLLDEDTINETATSIATFLWKLGWRKVETVNPKKEKPPVFDD